MKIGLLFTCVLLIVAACNKNSGLPPVINPSPDLNYYAGTYFGEYSDTSNGVDSNGVFKTDTTYTIVLKLIDGGKPAATPKNQRVYTITIIKGPLVINSIPVDATGHFAFVDYNRNFTGHFANDSLFISSKALNGSYHYPQWFVIQKLGFRGRKEY